LVLLGDKPIDYYLPLPIYANKSIPLPWQKNISDWEKLLINLLYRPDNKLLNLPHLFMAILKHFLTMLSTNNIEYHPNKILTLLNLNRSRRGYSLRERSINPLKIYDPLNIISNFCETLGIVWDNRRQANLTGFKVFKFDGRGLLSGKRSADDSHSTTILAFCGGWIQGQGKCGYSPLVIGKDSNCHYCGKLICPQDNCGYCSSNCPGYEERKQDDEDK
jgi:hypothetical protein